MPEESKTEKKEGFLEKIFDHSKGDKGGEQQKSRPEEVQGKEPHKPQESEMDKFKDYIKEDEKLEEEGRTYGGLM